jgi:hypothetical protein
MITPIKRQITQISATKHGGFAKFATKSGESAKNYGGIVAKKLRRENLCNLNKSV